MSDIETVKTTLGSEHYPLLAIEWNGDEFTAWHDRIEDCVAGVVVDVVTEDAIKRAKTVAEQENVDTMALNYAHRYLPTIILTHPPDFSCAVAGIHGVLVIYTREQNGKITFGQLR